MATILVKWKQLGNALQSVRFSSTVGHWAEGRIVTVIEKGFCSDQPLTRAEAVIPFIRLTGRGLIAGMLQQVWSDVIGLSLRSWKPLYRMRQ
ncbi:hypothetical protein [Bacillus chungangensis]|uniref:Uncharacterized protein n=1 Tax=Bacillus chungangensis TaxID=587633 RepID=A0ABT9WRL4_9BACI|nr:hypothetical protein [Bacillus chungangensis]MDQ0175941.1 hypothetical protein [Bacillus chungangensis]